MEFIKITDLKKCADVKVLYHDSFPIEEQVDFYSLFSGVFKDYELYAIYDKNKLMAMAHFKETEGFVHVNYLAVKSEYQSQGYGSAFLTFIKEKFNHKALVLDIEELDEQAINNLNRIRRIKFYKKNGFKEGKYKFHWEGVLMTYMNTGKINAEDFMRYIQIVFPTIKDVAKK